MYLATITCNRDFQQMLLQAESIQKFVEPCKHVIVINEQVPDIEFWQRWLAPYYTNHTLEIIPAFKYEYPLTFLGVKNEFGQTDPISQGWRTQQLQKLLLAYKFDDDYLLLDSKNFFIKKTNINEWDNTIGSGKFINFSFQHHYIKTYNFYKEALKKEMSFYAQPCTPFKISKDALVNNCKYSELAHLLFYPEFHGRPASEGVFYSFFVSKEIEKNVDKQDTKSLTVWASNKPNLSNILFEISSNPDIKVTGIHREILSTMDHKEKKIIDYWLNSDGQNCLNFTNKIYPLPRDSHV